MENFFITIVRSIQIAGNKQRALSFVLRLMAQLKHAVAGYPILDKYPLHTLGEKDLLQLINKCLYNLKPAFHLQRLIKSGKPYDLPVPISEKRATFLAFYWLRKAVFKNNKNDLSFDTLLAQEISAAFYRDGSAKEFLKAYIDIALDQRPFSKFIKKKSFSIPLSKRTRIGKRLAKLKLQLRRNLSARSYRDFKTIRKINKHHYRHTRFPIITRLRRKKPEYRHFK